MPVGTLGRDGGGGNGKLDLLGEPLGLRTTSDFMQTIEAAGSLDTLRWGLDQP